jgi:regulatory protein
MNNEMDTIVGCEPVPRQPALVRVVFQHHEPLELPIRVWTDYALKIGRSLHPSTLEELERAAQVALVRRQITRYLSVKPRTVHEVDAYMRRRGIATWVREAVLNELRDHGIVDDELYSKMYIQSRGKRLSHAELLWRLKSKGVRGHVVKPLLESADSAEDEFTAAYIAGKKHWGRHRDRPLRERRRKLTQYLSRRGFPIEVIRSVMAKLEDEAEDDLS